MRRLGFLILIASGVACAEETNPLADDPKAVAAGAETFRGACSACHGVNADGGHGPSLVRGREINRASDAQLFKSIRQGVSGTDMPGLPGPDERIWQLVAFVRSLTQPAVRARLPGDSSKGRGLFFGKTGCAKCHAIGGEGGMAGPDLSDVAALRTVKQIEEALFEPNARIEDGFAAVSVTTRDGRKLVGVARNWNNYSMQLQETGGKLHLLDRTEIANWSRSPKSLMPEGYAEKLSAEERKDLMAFLSRQAVHEEEPEPAR